MRPYYVLNEDHTVSSTSDILAWGRCLESANRIVKQTHVGPVFVSTVFLGIDHNFYVVGPPILFETMVFGGPLDEDTRRYSTWDEAAYGHERVVAEVLQARYDLRGWFRYFVRFLKFDWWKFKQFIVEGVKEVR